MEPRDESKSRTVVIRKAKREDCTEIMELKKELAEHSNMGGLPMLSVEELERDGFDVEPPCFECLVAEYSDSKKLMGYALYFYAYSAWEGKTLFLEDLCVSKNARGGGIGSKMLKQLAKIGVDEKCARIQLEVGDWNETGLKFYDSHGGWNTTVGEGWHNYRLDKAAIERLACDVGTKN